MTRLIKLIEILLCVYDSRLYALYLHLEKIIHEMNNTRIKFKI